MDLHCLQTYSRLSLSLSPWDSLKNFEISVPQICIIEEKINRATTFHKEYVIWLLRLEIAIEIVNSIDNTVEKGE